MATKIKETGVLANSDVYFHTASEAAKRMYFYLRCTGRYECDEHYAVSRQAYDSFLILHVLHGHGYCYLEGKRVEISEGSFVMLDCYQPHRYGTESGWGILWIHFDGLLAREYFQAVLNGKKQLFIPINPYNAMHGLEKIFRMYHFEKRAVEALVSKNIVAVLTEFLVFDTAAEKGPEHSACIEELLSYISEHIDAPLSLECLAQRVSLSPFYFSRIFKKETGHTVRDYLILTRVNAAKFYLKTASMRKLV